MEQQEQTVNPRGSYLLRLDAEQRAQLNGMAAEAGLPIQYFIEQQLFGQIKPRKAGRPRKIRPQAQLPLPTAEAPIKRTA